MTIMAGAGEAVASQMMSVASDVGSSVLDAGLSLGVNYLLNQDAYKKNLEMWNAQNAYNSPAAQMVRLKAAGLNPALVYGSGNATMRSADAPEFQPPEVSSFLGKMSEFANVKNLELQSKNIAQLNKKLVEETEGVKKDNALKQYTIDSMDQANKNPAGVRVQPNDPWYARFFAKALDRAREFVGSIPKADVEPVQSVPKNPNRRHH